MPKLNQRGFSHLLLIILLLLVIAGIVFAGLNVWNSRKTTKEDPITGSSSVTKETPEPPAPAPTRVAPTSEAFEVTLPDGWVDGRCEDSADIVFLAPTADLLGKCQTESFGMVSVSRAEGDQRRTEESFMADDYYGSTTYEAVTIDDLPGYKVTYTVATETELGYPPVGTYEAMYHLYDADSNKTYILGYRQFEGDPDHKATFATIAESFARL